MWFEGGLGVHFDAASDWTLRWWVSEAGDDKWMSQYNYDFDGHWVMRRATGEAPFVRFAGSRLTSATPVFNQVDQVVGVALSFEVGDVTLSLREGEIDTSFG
jgi:hypothetical protein